MHTLLIILYILLSLFVLAAIIFLAVGIYVLIYIKRHVKNVADKATETIVHFRENPHMVLGKILGIPILAYLVKKAVGYFL